MSDYKTMRKYKCPYCDYKGTRNELIDHVDDMHSSLLPEGYTAARAIYDFINKKNYGICMICKSKVYKWNDKINRYYNICDNAKCRKIVRERALKNHIKIYNKPHLLNDPEQQEKMLAARKISGTYTFSDGGKVTYTGSYEKKCLEFMDQVMEIPSKDIQAPGPILKYRYEGKEHFWITDIYYIPANLLIEVKDGGSNPNNRSMPSYREKQIAKETMITDLGTFNYIRLTNNDFSQLLDIFADMKNAALTDQNSSPTIHVNEEVGGLPANKPSEAYIVPFGMNNVFDGFAYADSEDENIVYPTEEGLKTMNPSEFENKFNVGCRLYYNGDDKDEKIRCIREYIGNVKKVHPTMFVEMITGKKCTGYQDLFFCNNFNYFSRANENTLHKMLLNGIRESAYTQDSNVDCVSVDGYVTIKKSVYGYYATTPADFYMASDYYTDIEDLKKSGIIDIMNNFYKSNHKSSL